MSNIHKVFTVAGGTALQGRNHHEISKLGSYKINNPINKGKKNTKKRKKTRKGKKPRSKKVIVQETTWFDNIINYIKRLF